MRDDSPEALWREADAVLDRLLDLAPSLREAALAQMTLPDAVRERVRRLLAAHARPLPLLERPPLLLAADPASGPAFVDRVLGGWRIERELGRGGMAVVFAAHRVDRPEHQAALKLMTLGALAGGGAERFRQEQAILARLDHPHIAALFDAGVAEDGTPWLAMARVDGERIDRWCDARGLGTRARLRLMLDVCDAVAYAHRNLVVHRDLKPSNVLVDAEGHVRLLDFGIARWLDDGAEATSSLQRVLSPQYAAPEQFDGAAPSTVMDVYGLGALLYQVLCGRPPRVHGDGPATAPTAPSRAARETATPGLHDLDAELDAIVLRALAPDPASRYASVAAFADDLERWLQGRPIQAWTDAGRAYRWRKFIGRHRIGVAATAALILAIVAGAIGTLSQAERAREQAQRAIAERQRAEQALTRVTAMRDFLLGLFTANYPDRPPGQLPSTAQLLEQGVRLARAGDGADVVVRAEMLITIGRIYFARGLAAEAQALLDEAAGLAQRHPELPPGVHAQLQRSLGDLAEARSDVAGAIAHYDAAIAQLQDGESPSLELLDLEGKRGFLEVLRQDYAAAIARLEPLHARLREMGAPPARQRRLLGALAVAYARGERYPQARQAQTDLIALAREVDGADSRGLALAHSNAIGLYVKLGEFATAEASAMQALAIYDRLSPAPAQYRAGTRIALGDIERYRGRIDAALAAYQAGYDELGAMLGLADRSAQSGLQLSRGRALASVDRFDEAQPALRRAIELLQAQPSSGGTDLPEALAYLALTQCGSAQQAAGRATLDQARRHSGDDVARELRVAFDEAQASCDADTAPVDALAALEHAASLDAQAPPGEAFAVARRERRRAALLDRLQRDAEAAALRAVAAQRLRDVGLAEAPR
jgi:tetratricopeptide (TPR) repeat protein